MRVWLRVSHLRKQNDIIGRSVGYVGADDSTSDGRSSTVARSLPGGSRSPRCRDSSLAPLTHRGCQPRLFHHAYRRVSAPTITERQARPEVCPLQRVLPGRLPARDPEEKLRVPSLSAWAPVLGAGLGEEPPRTFGRAHGDAACSGLIPVDALRENPSVRKRSVAGVVRNAYTGNHWLARAFFGVNRPNTLCWVGSLQSTASWSHHVRSHGLSVFSLASGTSEHPLTCHHAFPAAPASSSSFWPH